jgi:hypothetical protein
MYCEVEMRFCDNYRVNMRSMSMFIVNSEQRAGFTDYLAHKNAVKILELKLCDVYSNVQAGLLAAAVLVPGVVNQDYLTCSTPYTQETRKKHSFFEESNPALLINAIHLWRESEELVLRKKILEKFKGVDHSHVAKDMSAITTQIDYWTVSFGTSFLSAFDQSRLNTKQERLLLGAVSMLLEHSYTPRSA